MSSPTLVGSVQARGLDRLAVGNQSLGGMYPMAPSLLELMEELLQSIEQRDAGDPDAPAWEASARIQRLEEELTRRLHDAGVERGAVAVAGADTHRPGEALSGIA